MKKTFFTASIILASLIGSTAFAQTPVTEAGCCEKVECTADSHCKDAQKCDKKGGQRHKGHKGHGQRPNLFEGIELTADQQTALEALRPARGERKAKEAKPADMQTRQEAGKARFDEYKTKVKGILTPEQYTQFEQNLQKMESKRMERKGNLQKGKADTKVKRQACDGQHCAKAKAEAAQ